MGTPKTSFLIFVFFILVIGLTVGFFRLLSVSQLNSDQYGELDDLSTAGPGDSVCKKLGINYAWPWTTDVNAYNLNTKARNFQMGYTLEMFTDNDQNQINWRINSIRDAIDKGLTPIVRICTGDSCPWSNPADYVGLLRRISEALGPSRTFYAIAGPNEPEGEVWLGGTPGDANSIGPRIATYMNSVISGVRSNNLTNVKLISPVFNLTHPQFENFVTVMNNNGARFNELYAIGGNGYNLNGYPLGQTLTDFVNRASTKFASIGISKPIIMTEIGMFESERNPNWTGARVPHAQALQRLASEITNLKQDTRVEAYLLFSSFGVNPDLNFDYNEISDSEFAQIIGDCSGVIQPPGRPTLPACGPLDRNGGNLVGLIDFSHFMRMYGDGCLTGSEAYVTRCGRKDVNVNGTIDDPDFLNLSRRFNDTCQ